MKRFHAPVLNNSADVDVVEQNPEKSVEMLLCQIRDGSEEDRCNALNTLLEHLEQEDEEWKDALVEMNSLHVLMDCLDAQMELSAQLAALMVFADITSGSKRENQAVVNSGAVLPFISLIDSHQITIAEQALICVGNIACEDAFTRKVVYENGGLHAIVRFLGRDDLESEQLNSGVWAFSNMCRSRTLISLDALTSCIHVIKMLLTKEDSEILRSGCAASAYLMDGPIDRIQMFLDAELCEPISKLIHHSDPLVVFSALRAISNFLSGSDDQIERVVALDVISHLAYVLKQHKERRIVKEACMALSNIAAGSQMDILKIIDADIVEDLIHAARHAPLDVRTEATWALGNSIVGSGHALIKEFLTAESMKVLSSALTSKNPDVVKLALQAIRNFLWCGDFGEDPNFDLTEWDSENDEEFWEHAEWLSNAHGFFRLAALRQHPDYEISQSALQLLGTLVEDPCAEYFDDEANSVNSTDDELSDYEDLLEITQSPTAPQ